MVALLIIEHWICAPADGLRPLGIQHFGNASASLKWPCDRCREPIFAGSGNLIGASFYRSSIVMGDACSNEPTMEWIMFASEAGTFIRALPGEGATLRSLLIKDAVGSFPNGATKPEILTCDVDVDFICLKESEETGFIFLSDETKCCIASLAVVVGGDVNRDIFH
ncbi:hypothetical protein [Sinorhizobium meliloti]|uniref:hypothetical protein n=1 Tax=Rhizobium meliloti TaxID=382 RepID=UPI00237F9BB7|nr:hypothetical protein [Sinorhizobium meliloti]